MPVSADQPDKATGLSDALAEYERQVADAGPQPQPLPAKDFMTDKEAAVFWFAEWERKRDEWLRGWQVARVLSDAIREHLNGPSGPQCEDELEPYIAEQMKDPAFAAAFHAAESEGEGPVVRT